MTEHPITPPPELVREWEANWLHSYEPGVGDIRYFVATRAAQWGADLELGACCAWLQCNAGEFIHADLRAARRPKPQSLKQQALCALIDGIARGGNDPSDIDTIRRALDLLPD
jgi:hypothetical protein